MLFVLLGLLSLVLIVPLGLLSLVPLVLLGLLPLVLFVPLGLLSSMTLVLLDLLSLMLPFLLLGLLATSHQSVIDILPGGLARIYAPYPPTDSNLQ